MDAVDPVAFYGVNNANVQLIKNLFPKVRIAARGNVMKVIGDEKETEVFEEKIKLLEKHCAEYNQLSEEVIIDSDRTAVCTRWEPARSRCSAARQSPVRSFLPVFCGR